MAQLSDDCFAFGGPMMSVDEAVGLITARVTAIGAIAPLRIRDRTAPAGTDAVKGERQVWFRTTGSTNAAVYDRARMPVGLAVQGPAIIESLESTILVPPGWQARMDEDGFVVLKRA